MYRSIIVLPIKRVNITSIIKRTELKMLRN